MLGIVSAFLYTGTVGYYSSLCPVLCKFHIENDLANFLTHSAENVDISQNVFFLLQLEGDCKKNISLYVCIQLGIRNISPIYVK